MRLATAFLALALRGGGLVASEPTTQPRADACVDFQSSEDKIGNDCAYYKQFPMNCGKYDNDNFKAGNCCACVGQNVRIVKDESRCWISDWDGKKYSNKYSVVSHVKLFGYVVVAIFFACIVETLVRHLLRIKQGGESGNWTHAYSKDGKPFPDSLRKEFQEFKKNKDTPWKPDDKVKGLVYKSAVFQLDRLQVAVSLKSRLDKIASFSGKLVGFTTFEPVRKSIATAPPRCHRVDLYAIDATRRRLLDAWRFPIVDFYRFVIASSAVKDDCFDGFKEYNRQYNLGWCFLMITFAR